jgi:two-component system, cell cycle response regulator
MQIPLSEKQKHSCQRKIVAEKGEDMSPLKMVETQKRNDAQTELMVDDRTIKNEGSYGANSCLIPTLTFLSGGVPGTELPLIQQKIRLGRGRECDVVITDPSISQQHAQLNCRRISGKGQAKEVRVVLRDLGSTNGTMVNQRRVRRAVLKPGDTISLGRVILKYEQRDLSDRNFYDEIYRLVTTDPLTSLLNKETVLRELSDELTERKRYRAPLSILMISLDDFKSLNDTYGPSTGDLALQAVARLLQKNVRRQDRIGRFGYEEILVVLPETAAKGAASVAERIRKDIEGTISADLKIERDVTASIGLASYPMDGHTIETLLERVDAALYRAKALGKNRLEIWKESNAMGSRF